MKEIKVLKRTAEGDRLFDMGWKNYAQLEGSYVILGRDGNTFCGSPYTYLEEVKITNREYLAKGYVNAEKVYHNGHCISGEGKMVDGIPYRSLREEDAEDIHADRGIMKMLKQVFGTDSVTVSDIKAQFEDRWIIIKYKDEVGFVAQRDDRDGGYLIDAANPLLKDLFLSIYKVQKFIELDISSFVNMDEVDKLKSLELLEAERDSEKEKKISRVKIAELLDMDKDTLYKLDKKIKDSNCPKSQKKLDNYIDLYLYRKYLA